MLRSPLGLLAVSLVLLAPPIPEAEACGGFFSRKNLVPERRPSLTHEQVLMIHHGGREHFIREVAFRRADASFGFVVPTPARPEVEAVTESPFAALRASYPFRQHPISSPAGGGGRGATSSRGGAGFGVKTLEIKKVGSFTAFVLAADDPKALSSWLSQQGFTSTPEADEWLAHYVRSKFYYVAMRYDPPANAEATGAIATETMRISFDTPAPYYPYYEPRLAAGTTPANDRLVDVWLVSDLPRVPVALWTQKDQAPTWVRPMREGRRVDGVPFASGGVSTTLRPLLPSGNVTVQTFQDQKISRAGFGDIVFLPKKSQGVADTEPLKPLLGALDPALLESR